LSNLLTLTKFNYPILKLLIYFSKIYYRLQ